LQTDLGAWSLDEACLQVGRRIEKIVNAGKDPFGSDAPVKGNYRKAKGTRPIKKVKIKADGTF
jgi:hypothetical protein